MAARGYRRWRLRLGNTDVAREWSVEGTLQLIVEKLTTIAPDNESLVPFAFSYEKGLWHVYVEVKRKHCEYDVHSADETLLKALKGVYKRLGNWQLLERSSPL